MRAGDDVGGDQLAQTVDGGCPGIDGGLDSGDVAPDHDGDIGRANFFFAH